MTKNYGLSYEITKKNGQGKPTEKTFYHGFGNSTKTLYDNNWKTKFLKSKFVPINQNGVIIYLQNPEITSPKTQVLVKDAQNRFGKGLEEHFELPLIEIGEIIPIISSQGLVIGKKDFTNATKNKIKTPKGFNWVNQLHELQNYRGKKNLPKKLWKLK